jgi:hypothetical protein
MFEGPFQLPGLDSQVPRWKAARRGSSTFELWTATQLHYLQSFELRLAQPEFLFMPSFEKQNVRDREILER